MFGLSSTLIPNSRSPQGQSGAIVIEQSTTNGRTRKRAHGTREMSAQDIDRDLTRGSMHSHTHIYVHMYIVEKKRGEKEREEGRERQRERECVLFARRLLRLGYFLVAVITRTERCSLTVFLRGRGRNLNMKRGEGNLWTVS